MAATPPIDNGQNINNPIRTQRGIQSVEVGGRILKALTAAAGPMMLKDLAHAAQLSAASAHPYLVSLIKLALVDQDPDTGRYTLGAFALEMGMASLRQRDELRLASICAATLASTSGLSVAVAVWGNLGATIVRLEAARRPLHVSLQTGSVMSLVNTATGQVFGAWLPKAIWVAQIEREASTVGGAPGGTEIDTANALFERVKKQGMARAAGLPIPGVNAFSAPVFDHDGELSLVITVLGAAGDLSADWSNPIADQLRTGADALSKQLGWRG